MLIEQLGPEAAELLSLTDAGGAGSGPGAGAGQGRSLLRLAELAAWRVAGCSGATATTWQGQDPVSSAATHPGLAWLDELQLASGAGPLPDALRTGSPVTCRDTLTEERWPGYAQAALGLGVRCSVHLVSAARDQAPVVLVLSLSGVRPGALGEAGGAAGTLAAFGGTMLANATAYGAARQIAGQFKDAVAARSVTDQAKGILMHALGCSADEALRRMRAESQRRHIKVTEVASQVVAAYGGKTGGKTGGKGGLPRITGLIAGSRVA